MKVDIYARLLDRTKQHLRIVGHSHDDVLLHLVHKVLSDHGHEKGKPLNVAVEHSVIRQVVDTFGLWLGLPHEQKN